jgi:C1A family cysteine protease
MAATCHLQARKEERAVCSPEFCGNSAPSDPLRFRIARAPAVTQDERIAELSKETEELKAKLRMYEKLEEDLMAQRVFVKARRQLTGWITVGGLVAFTVGFVGFRQVESYTRHLVTQRVKTVADAQVRQAMLDEGKRQVLVIVNQEKGSIQAYVNERINKLVALQPINATAGSQASVPSALTAPTKVARLDYSAQMLPVRDQGAEGSVVGFVVAEALEFEIEKKLGQRVVISPRYLYYYAIRQGGGNPHVDSGATIKDALTVVSTKGAVAETAWPYKPGDLAANPPPAITSAKKYRTAESRSLKGTRQIKAALQQYGPVMVGLSVYQSFMSPDTAKTGLIPDPKPNEALVGGHAICIVGYDDTKRLFKFENSWGTSWGKKG